MKAGIPVIRTLFGILIIGAILGAFIWPLRHVRADDPPATDPDDPTAVWACVPGIDADGNPVQTCGFGHYQQDCSYQAGVESCQQDFEPDPPTGAELFAPIAAQIVSTTSFALSASWNGTLLAANASTSLAIGKPGTLFWQYTPTTLPPRGHGPQSFSDVLSTATLTLDLYKGVVGSSTLVYSETVSSSTSGTLPLTFDSTGPYFLAFSATYPDGSYPPGESPGDICTNDSGDFCDVPAYSLADFQNAMTQGDSLEEASGDLGNYVPAAYGILPFTTTDAPAALAVSNVLFLPGTLESRLYMKTPLGEHRVWEPLLDTDVASLMMNPNGTSKNVIYTRDIIDHLYSDNPTFASLVKSKAGDTSVMYGPFEDFMNGLVANGTIKQWQAYPYDWRYDVSDIVQNGTLVGTATGTPTRVYLQDVVQALASSSPTGKVTIIAHSNGGLVAKALAVELQKEGKIGLLDRLIMVGTPQLGTPLTIGSMLHGDDDTKVAGIVMYSGTFRAVSITTPGPYDLLPSSAYFNKVQGPVVSFANDLLDAPYRAAYGAAITSFAKLASFLTDASDTRTVPAVTDELTPAVLSNAYIQKAAATHAAIDPWIPPASLAVTSIVGWGQPSVSQYYYSSQLSGWNCSFSGFLQLKCGGTPMLKHFHANTDDGDNTVVVPSANALGQVLYLDTKAFGNSITHQSLLSATSTQDQIKDLLEGSATIEQSLSMSEPTGGANPLLVVSVHSPMNIVATDSNGNQTGLVSVPGISGIYFPVENIPDSSVDTVDDEKYISLPENGTYTFSLQAYASGETTIDVGVTDANGNSSTTQVFANIPTTASTTATFSVTQEVATAPAVDTDGDGKVDLIASSSVSNTATSSTITSVDEQFKTLRGRYGIGALLLLTLEKLRLGKNTPDIQNAIDCVEKFFGANVGDALNSNDASSLQQSISILRL